MSAPGPALVEEVESSYRRGYKKSNTLRLRAWKHVVPLRERSSRSAQAGQHTDPLRPPTPDKLHLTGKDVLLQLCLLIKYLQGSQGPHMVHCFLNATLSPPITSESLSELDIVRIINNPKLRHDVNFDRELSFRPNLEGPNRKEKFRAADEYWTALTAELTLYTHLFDGSSSACQVQEQHRVLYIAGSRKRVPLLFETLRDTLKTLVPERDQPRIEEVLDVPMLMQQFEKGVCDLAGLSRWLAQLLKAHCAPMRDRMVDHMVKQFMTGIEDSSQIRVVKGLQELFAILETMKLDVANHQIRHLRGLLIEDTVHFEQKYHLHQIAQRRTNIDDPRSWFAQHESSCTINESIGLDNAPASDHTRVLTSALLQTLLSSGSGLNLPVTFALDLDRLSTLRSDLRDIIYEEICCEILSLVVSPMQHGVEALSSEKQALRGRLLDIVGSARMWARHIANIAAEIVRSALRISGSPAEVDTSIAPCLESWLQRHLHPSSQLFRKHARQLAQLLHPCLNDSMTAHLGLASTALHDSLVPTAPPPPPRGYRVPVCNMSTGETQAKLSDVTRRLTHIAVLHWQIWGPIAYAYKGSKADDAAADRGAGDVAGLASYTFAVATA
ncbi:hypothetical protein B0A49_10051 [Cryomyces minteri]|uniref:Tcp11-domain-containing protein n=1 Tax=Cryomyces minteri TaxID=331657 RepID=A0A4U0WIS5_9PEZI|nr:hypothetical protein B0A49_10051 [Cryomyces minteri]